MNILQISSSERENGEGEMRTGIINVVEKGMKDRPEAMGEYAYEFNDRISIGDQAGINASCYRKRKCKAE